jgi:DNA mismatch repair ATPase MutL
VELFRKARATNGSICRAACLLTFIIAAICAGMAQDQQQQPPTDQPSPKSTDQQSQPSTPDQTNPQQASPQSQPQTGENPDEKKPDEKKDDNANPAVAVKDATIQAAQATEKLGQLALVKATDWEASWFTGVFIPKGAQRTPLTRDERRELYLEQTLTTPGAYMKRMFAAGIDQARGVPYQWDDGWAGYTERFA